MSIIELTNESINDSVYISLNEFIFKLIDSKNGLWLSIGPFYSIKDGDYYPGLFNKVNKNSYMLNTTIVDQWIDCILESTSINVAPIATAFNTCVFEFGLNSPKTLPLSEMSLLYPESTLIW